MKKQYSGYLAIVISALIFGFTPILAAISYSEGNNGINMAFLRAVIPIPFFLFISFRSFSPTGKQLRNGILAGILSFGCTLLLYSSYEYISPGLATTLHFLYPLYVAVINAIMKHHGLKKTTIAGLAFALVGIILFLEPNELRENSNIEGYLLALGSGLVYACYIIILEKESADPLPLYHLMLIMSVTGAVLCGAVGLLAGKLTVISSGRGWLFAGATAFLTAIVACVLFQNGVRKTGGTNAAIFSLLEPISSVLFSILLLGESLSIRSAVGCGMILLGLAIIFAYNIRKKRKTHITMRWR